jgi:DNA-binding MarR family transcriptional regulator
MTVSISRDTFESSDEEELESLSIPDQVLGFLAVNGDRASEAQEIAAQIGVDEGAVSTALTRLTSTSIRYFSFDLGQLNRP